MSTPQKYDDLRDPPSYGVVEMKGAEKSWSIEVSVEQGRAMEADGIEVFWTDASAPVWVPAALRRIWFAANRVFTWPERWVNGGQK